jgi:hypothetical protein
LKPLAYSHRGRLLLRGTTVLFAPGAPTPSRRDGQISPIRGDRTQLPRTGYPRLPSVRRESGGARRGQRAGVRMCHFRGGVCTGQWPGPPRQEYG